MTTYVTVTQTEVGTTINRNVVTVTPNVVENAISINDGVRSFLGLIDTPTTYVSFGGKVVAVKSDESGLEFITVTGGSGVSVTLATRVSILHTHPTAGSLAFSTDTHEFYVYTGSAWYKATLPFILDTLVTASGLNFSIAANSQYIPMVNS